MSKEGLGSVSSTAKREKRGVGIAQGDSSEANTDRLSITRSGYQSTTWELLLLKKIFLSLLYHFL